jgi:hypothetical protein
LLYSSTIIKNKFMEGESGIFKEVIDQQQIKQLAEKIIKKFEDKSGAAWLTGQGEASLIKECIEEMGLANEDQKEVVQYLIKNWKGQGDIIRVIFN